MLANNGASTLGPVSNHQALAQPQIQVMSPSLESEKQAQALLAIENSCNEASNAIVNAFGLQEANSHGVSALDQSTAMDVSSQSPDKQTYKAAFNVLKDEHIALRQMWNSLSILRSPNKFSKVKKTRLSK